MTKNINIEVYTTYFTIPCSEYGIIDEYVSINNVLNFLTKYSFVRKRTARGFYINVKEPTAFYYNYSHKTQLMHLPRYLLQQVLDVLEKSTRGRDYFIDVKYKEPVHADKIELSMVDGWVDREEQVVALKHVLRTDLHIKCNNLQTGKGKSALAIRAIEQLGLRAMIVCDGIMDQWVTNLVEKTNIKEEEIYTVAGVRSLLELLNHPEYKPKVIVWSIQTLRLFIMQNSEPYNEVISFQEFLEYYGIGIFIRDEFHTHLDALVKIDLKSNVEHNIYLSATPRRNDYAERNIFDAIYPKITIGGGNVYDRYVDITCLAYDYEVRDPRKYTGFKGYSQYKYEKLVLNNTGLRDMFFEKLYSMVHESFLIKRKTSPESKLIIYSALSSMTEEIADFFKEKCPDMRVDTYIESDSDEKLKDLDIISSNLKKAGTGLDVANLATVINTISTQDETAIKQLLGRLRKNPKLKLDMYDVHNRGVDKHVQHFRRRSQIYRQLSKTYNQSV